MTGRQKQAYAKLLDLDRKLTMIGHIDAVLGYDFETVMSSKGGDERALQSEWLSSQVHEMATDKKVGGWLEVLDGVTEATDEEKALIRVWKKQYGDAVRVPSKLVGEISRATSECQNRWFTARQDGDWKTFCPFLEKLVKLKKERASLIADGKSLYDTMLDRNDTGFDSATIEKLFDSMQNTILDVVKGVEESGNQVTDKEEAFLYGGYDVEKQKKFSRRILEDMGFEFDRSSIGVVAHPFTSTVGCDDIRITTRF